MTRTDLNRKIFKNHAAAPRLAEALAVLAKSGAAYSQREKTGGADREVWKPTGGVAK